MGNPVLDEGRVGEGGRTGGRDTAPVVHVHVDDPAPLLHLGDGLAVHEGRCTGAYALDRPYKEVRAQPGVPDRGAARTQDDHASWPHARRATEEYSAAPEGPLQVVGAYLRGETACDLAHRR